MNAAPRLRSLVVATAFLLPLGLAANASAQAADDNLTDSDSVTVTAEVVADMIVAGIADIDLGILPQGSAFEVAADPTAGEFASAQFNIEGPTDLDWTLTVVWNDLEHTTTAGEFITLEAPSTDDICFTNGQNDDSGNCDASIESGGDVTGHGGDGTAWVGYSVTVPADATVGDYEGSIELTADARLGG